MILSFADKDTEKIWNQQYTKKFGHAVQRLALRKLIILNRSGDVNDLRIPPVNRLERLKGNRSGQYSIRINDQWRICFKWTRGNATDVEIVDTH